MMKHFDHQNILYRKSGRAGVRVLTATSASMGAHHILAKFIPHVLFLVFCSCV